MHTPCNLHETPKAKLLFFLNQRGYYHVSSKVRLSNARLAFDPFQEIAVRLLVWGGQLSSRNAYGGPVKSIATCCGRNFYYHGWGSLTRVDAVYVSEGFEKEFVRLNDDTKPLIVIELSQLLEHRLENEYASLRSQIASTLGVIRLFLWDAHLLLTSARDGLYSWLSPLLGRARVRITSLSVGDALEELGVRNVVLLDPNADESLSSNDVKSAEAFIVGGIVDRVPRPGATAKLLRLIPWAKRRRVELRGSIIGVPNRLNAIVEIILKARYKFCGNIEKAILDTMSPHDVRLRAYVEIARRAGKAKKIDWNFYCELRKWLPLTINDFVKAARMAHVELVGSPKQGECREDSGQQRPISS